ncbi:MAG: hypothetical protein M0Z46_10915 [Actinomycetota bacterium]|jgi:hypothetical protein|nr:hypothetical protein [Actinomycetota bacterium]
MALMDEVARQQFLETLRNDEELRAAVRRELLTEELLSTPQTVTALSGDVRALVETTRNLLQTSVAGFENIGREAAQHKAQTAAGFTTAGARFDQLGAAIAELKRERGT